MKVMRTCVALFLAGLAITGCGAEPADPMARKMTPYLAQLRDHPGQEQMFKAIGACEELREGHGHEAVADTLKQIARGHPDVRDQALSLLARYVSVQDYADFVMKLKMEN